MISSIEKASLNVHRIINHHSIFLIEAAVGLGTFCFFCLRYNCPDIAHSSLSTLQELAKNICPLLKFISRLSLERELMKTAGDKDGKRKKRNPTYKQITKWRIQ
jgi:hypothetical protein